MQGPAQHLEHQIYWYFFMYTKIWMNWLFGKEVDAKCWCWWTAGFNHHCGTAGDWNTSVIWISNSLSSNACGEDCFRKAYAHCHPANHRANPHVKDLLRQLMHTLTFYICSVWDQAVNWSTMAIWAFSKSRVLKNRHWIGKRKKNWQGDCSSFSSFVHSVNTFLLPVTLRPSERSHQTCRDEPLHGPDFHL